MSYVTVDTMPVHKVTIRAKGGSEFEEVLIGQEANRVRDLDKALLRPGSWTCRWRCRTPT